MAGVNETLDLETYDHEPVYVLGNPVGMSKSVTAPLAPDFIQSVSRGTLGLSYADGRSITGYRAPIAVIGQPRRDSLTSFKVWTSGGPGKGYSWTTLGSDMGSAWFGSEHSSGSATMYASVFIKDNVAYFRANGLIVSAAYMDNKNPPHGVDETIASLKAISNQGLPLTDSELRGIDFDRSEDMVVDYSINVTYPSNGKVFVAFPLMAFNANRYVFYVAIVDSDTTGYHDAVGLYCTTKAGQIGIYDWAFNGSTAAYTRQEILTATTQLGGVIAVRCVTGDEPTSVPDIEIQADLSAGLLKKVIDDVASSTFDKVTRKVSTQFVSR